MSLTDGKIFIVVKIYDYELENGLEVLKLEENLYSSMGQNKEINYEKLARSLTKDNHDGGRIT